MPLAANPLGTLAPVEPDVPRIYEETYRHSIVDSSYRQESSLLTQVNGSPRRTEWYNPFINGDEETMPFGPGNAPTYQSYVRIKNFVIKQQGKTSFSFDPEKAISTEDGTAFVSGGPRFVPLRNACFIADVGDGNAGLFMITEQPEIKNVTANKVYECVFKFVTILTKDWFEMLDSRVVDEFIYSADSAIRGGTGIITHGEYQQAADIAGWIATLSSYIVKEYFWNPERTFVFDAPDGRKVYDPYLVAVLAGLIGPDYRVGYPIIGQFSLQYGGREFGSSGDTNVWEVLTRNDWNLLGRCKVKASYIETTRLANTRQYGNLRSSKIRWFVATDPERFGKGGAYYTYDGYGYLEPSAELEFDYLFTDSFYQGIPTTELENLTVEILRHKVIDRNRLLAFCETLWALKGREQLYTMTIVLMLLIRARAIEALV